MCPPRFNSVGKGQQSSTAQTLRVRKQQQQALKSQKKKTEKEHKTAIKGRKKKEKESYSRTTSLTQYRKAISFHGDSAASATGEGTFLVRGFQPLTMLP